MTVRSATPTTSASTTPDVHAPIVSGGGETDGHIPFLGDMRPALGDTLADELAEALASRDFVMTPEGILAMLRQRLGDMDQQIGMYMDAIDDATREAREIGQRASDLRAIQEHLEGHMDGDGKLTLESTTMRDDLSEAELQQLADSWGVSTESLSRPLRMDELLGAAIEQLGPIDGTSLTYPGFCYVEYVDAMTLPPPDGRRIEPLLVNAGFEFNEDGQLVGDITRERIQSAIQQANDDLRAVNSGNELLMVELQSRMQQRTSLIQMGSNMLKSTDEAMDSIVGNMR